jgi:uncharacterized phiE125 gp8 family phage protein
MARDFYEIKTPAATAPVTVTMVKDWCRIDHNQEDTLLGVIANTATNQLELATNRNFINRTWTGKFDTICVTKFERFPFIELARSPLISVDSVKVESGGSQLTISTSNYTVKNTSGYPRILFTETLPTFDEVAYPVEVEFQVGYGATSTDMPDDIRTMLKQYVLFLYENRGDVEAVGGISMPHEVRLIANRYRISNCVS